MKPFIFKLGDLVSIIESQESGQVIGRAEFTNSSNSYLVRYRKVDGSAVENWWNEDALCLTPGKA